MASSDEMQSATTCREAADLVVDRIYKACEDIGGGQGQFVALEDVVRCVTTLSCSPALLSLNMTSISLGEAQRMTSVYAKMEYGVKRLLWLGS